MNNESWVKASESTVPPRQKVLVAVKPHPGDYGYPWYDLAWRDEDGSWHTPHGSVGGEGTHWQPLPALPKEIARWW